MNTLLLKGKPVSDRLRSNLKSRVNKLASDGIIPKLAAILVGDDPASKIYIRNKSRAFGNLNCQSQTHEFPADCKEEDVLSLIDQLNHDMNVHGILIQLPLPQYLNSKKILHSYILRTRFLFLHENNKKI